MSARDIAWTIVVYASSLLLWTWIKCLILCISIKQSITLATPKWNILVSPWLNYARPLRVAIRPENAKTSTNRINICDLVQSQDLCLYLDTMLFVEFVVWSWKGQGHHHMRIKKRSGIQPSRILTKHRSEESNTARGLVFVINADWYGKIFAHLPR